MFFLVKELYEVSVATGQGVNGRGGGAFSALPSGAPWGAADGLRLLMFCISAYVCGCGEEIRSKISLI